MCNFKNSSTSESSTWDKRHIFKKASLLSIQFLGYVNIYIQPLNYQVPYAIFDCLHFWSVEFAAWFEFGAMRSQRNHIGRRLLVDVIENSHRPPGIDPAMGCVDIANIWELSAVNFVGSVHVLEDDFFIESETRKNGLTRKIKNLKNWHSIKHIWAHLFPQLKRKMRSKNTENENKH